MTAYAALLTPSTCQGTLSIDGLSLFLAGCWWALDLSELDDGSDLRGGDVPVPTGEVARARLRVGAVRTIPFVISGARDWIGGVHGNPDAGLLLNNAHFLANVVDPPATTAGTRTATWTWPNGTVKTAPITEVQWKKRRRPGALYVGALAFKVLNNGRFA